MAFYDFCANFYDASLEKALQLEPGMTVIDLPSKMADSEHDLVAGPSSRFEPR